MKAADFASVVRAYRDMAGATIARTDVDALAALLDRTPTATIAALVKKWTAASAAAGSERPSFGDIAAALRPLEAFVALAGKAAVVTDVGALLAMLQANPSAALASLAAAPAAKRKPASRAASPRADLIDKYARQLSGALGDPAAFARTYADLTADRSLTLPEVKAIAKQMTGVAPRSKAEALKKIDNAHQQQVTHRARAAATGGRSAA